MRNRGPAGKVEDMESLLRALEEAGGNKSAAARLLGVSRVTIWKRMKKHHLADNP
jgi:transcriptional regulator of acetoin/glycerol metabolism